MASGLEENLLALVDDALAPLDEVPIGGIRFVRPWDEDPLLRRAREHPDDRFAAFHDLSSQSREALMLSSTAFDIEQSRSFAV